jgi:hypothetical protein
MEGRVSTRPAKKKQLLTMAQEWALVQFILESADHGFPLGHCQIEQYADAVCQVSLGTDCVPVGAKWVFAFLDRHHNALRTFWSKSLDSQRARSLNPEICRRHGRLTG